MVRNGSALARASALAAGSLLLSGCGYVVVGTVGALLATKSSSKGTSSSPPTLEVASSTDRSALPSVTAIPVQIVLADASGQPVDVDATWAPTSSTTFFPATPAPTSEPLRGLASSPTGVTHTFVWNAQNDLRTQLAPTGQNKVAGVTLHLVPKRGGAAGFPVDVPIVAGLTPPRVTIVPPPSGGPVASRNVATSVLLADDAADPVDIHLFVSAPGIPRREVPLQGQSRGVSTSIGTGSPATIVWSSSDPAALGFANVTATIEVDVNDRFGGTGTATAQLAVVNDHPPSLQVLYLGTGNGFAPIDGRVPIRFALFDPDADEDPNGPSGTPDVRVEFSTNGGVSFQSATALALRSGRRDLGVATTVGLRAHTFPTQFEGPLGNVHTFLWDALADGAGGNGPTGIVVRLTPIERGVGSQPPLPGQADARTVVLGSTAPLLGPEIFGPNTVAGGPMTTPALGVGDLNGDGIPDAVWFGQSGSTVLLGQGDGTFVATVTTIVATRLVDVDGDGKLDLVDAAINPGAPGSIRVSVYRGDGAGGFVMPAVISDILSVNTILTGDLEIALADFNEDGRPDIAVIFNGQLLLAAGIGGGSFGPATAFATTGTRGISVGDLNGDGHADILLLDKPGQRVVVRLGTGTLSLQPEISFLDGADVQSTVLGDLNGDGKLDLVIMDSFSNEVSVWLGRGDGTFTGPTYFPTAGLLPMAGALADINHDGRLDLVVCDLTSNDLSVRLGTGDGGFGPEQRLLSTGRGPSDIALVDLNGDGNLDVIYSDSLSNDLIVRLATGGGGFGQDALVPSGLRTAIGLDDLNRDGQLDLVQATFDTTLGVSTLSLRLGTGGGAFAPETTSALVNPPRFAALADLNGDQNPDLLVTDDRGNVFVKLGDGMGGFAPTTTVTLAGAIPNQDVFVAVGDVDGDGRPDLVATPPLQLFTGNGLGGFAPPVLLATSGAGTPIRAALADLDGDGKLDLVTIYDAAPLITVRLGLGGGAFGPERALPFSIPFDRPVSIAIADLDGDGWLDVAVGTAGGNLDLWRGLGGGDFGADMPIANTNLGGSQAAQTIVIGDLDGDGRPDIVLAYSDVNFFGGQSNDLGVFFARPRAASSRDEGIGIGRGNGPATGLGYVYRHVVLSFTPHRIVLGDLSGKGTLDVAVANLRGPTRSEISAVVQPSAAVPSLATAGGVPVRAVPAPGLSTATVLSASLSLPAGKHLVPASRAIAFAPETATLAAVSSMTFALDVALIRSELATGVLHVLRWEQEQGVSTDPASGRVLFGRVLEVARRDPSGGPLPLGVTAAVVDTAKGTIAFQTTRLGRYQAFIEAPLTQAILYRETFDCFGPESNGLAPRAPGWSGAESWQTGAPFAAQLLPGPGQRPAPASAPNLLAVGLRRSYQPNTAVVTTSAAFALGPVPGTKRAFLRLQEWNDLALGDTGQISLVVTAGASSNTQLLRTYTGLSAGPVALATDETDVTAAIGAALAALGSPSNATARLTFGLTSGAGPPRRGWFVDDVELVIR